MAGHPFSRDLVDTSPSVGKFRGNTGDLGQYEQDAKGGVDFLRQPSDDRPSVGIPRPLTMRSNSIGSTPSPAPSLWTSVPRVTRRAPMCLLNS